MPLMNIVLNVQSVNKTLTRKHSVRLHQKKNASIATRYQQWWEGGPEVNKFEQVSSDGHQMSLAGDPCTVRSYVWMGPGSVLRVGSLYAGMGRVGDPVYSEVQCSMGNGQMRPFCGQTDTTENKYPSRNFFGQW